MGEFGFERTQIDGDYERRALNRKSTEFKKMAMANVGAPAQGVAAPFQMRRRNVDVTGELQISFAEIFVDEPGHFIHDKPFSRTEFYYEIRVDRTGGTPTQLCYGLTPLTLCLSNRLPEHDACSTVYKVTDGVVLVGVSGRHFNEGDKAVEVGDVFGCGIKFNYEIGSSVQSPAFTMRKVFFTKNRREIGYVYQKVPVAGVCPYIGLGRDDRTLVTMKFPAACEDTVVLAPPVLTDNLWAYSRFFNVIGDCEVLEYFGEGTATIVENGFAQAKRPMSRFNDYFTVTLDDLGHRSRIVAGVASRNFPNSTVLGLSPLSVGLYLEKGIMVSYDRGVLTSVNYGPPMVGDVIKVKVIFPDGYQIPPPRRHLPRGDTMEGISSDLESPAGDAPAGKAPSGEAPSGGAPSGEALAGEASAGEVPSRSEEVAGDAGKESGCKGKDGDAIAPALEQLSLKKSDSPSFGLPVSWQGDAPHQQRTVPDSEAGELKSKPGKSTSGTGVAVFKWTGISAKATTHHEPKPERKSDLHRSEEPEHAKDEVSKKPDHQLLGLPVASHGDAAGPETAHDSEPSKQTSERGAQASGACEAGIEGPQLLLKETSTDATVDDGPEPERKPDLPQSEEPGHAKDEEKVSESRGQPEGVAQAEQLEASGQAAAGQPVKPPLPSGPETFRLRRPSQCLSDCGVSMAGPPSSSSDERDLGDDVDRNYTDDEVQPGDPVNLADVLFYHVVPQPGQQPNEIHLGTVHGLRVPYSGFYPAFNFISRGARVTVDLHPIE